MSHVSEVKVVGRTQRVTTAGGWGDSSCGDSPGQTAQRPKDPEEKVKVENFPTRTTPHLPLSQSFQVAMLSDDCLLGTSQRRETSTSSQLRPLVLDPPGQSGETDNWTNPQQRTLSWICPISAPRLHSLWESLLQELVVSVWVRGGSL